MIIDRIEKYKGQTIGVYFENADPIFINREIVSRFNLKAGADVPESAVEQIVHANDVRRARERALYLLDAREYSYAGLFEKLEKNYDEDICFEVLGSLCEAGLVNDRRYAARLAEYYTETKGFGYYRALSEMRRKGIPKELAGKALSEYEDDSAERLYELVMKKYAGDLTDPKGINRVKNALARRGYSYDDINAVIKAIVDDE